MLVKAGSGALTFGNPDSAGVPAAFTQHTIVLPFNDTDAVKAAFAANKNQIAGIIVEPVPGNAGLYLPKPGYLEFLREITKANGALLIFDEVMTGFRLARGGAQERFGITPDLTCFGKGITSSLPLAVVAGRPDVMDMHPAGSMTSTHTGNPICCAAALASIDLVVRENLVENSRKMGDLLHRKLNELKPRFPQIGYVDGKGLVAGVACVKPGTKEPDGDLAWEVVRRSIEKGVLMFSPVGLGGCTVKICPPLVITEAAVEESTAVLAEAFAEVLAQ